MNKFLFKLFKFVSLQALVLTAIFAFYILMHQKTAQKQYLAATIDKHSLLEKQQKPRLIFVGGSNVAFGIDSDFIANKLKYSPVNMGLHAALGLEYTLNEVEDSLTKGDVVVVSLEYENFSSHLPDIPERLFNTVDSRPANIQFVPLYYTPVLLDKGQLYLGGVIRSVVSTAIGKYEFDPIYKRNNFDEYGDMTVNNGTPRDIAKIKGKLKVTRESVQTSVKIIQKFNQAAQQKGALVYFTYPPLAENVFKDNQKSINDISATLKSAAEIKIIDAPNEMALSANYFFDSEYHLNQSGVQFRAEHIARRLSELLN